MSLLRRPAADGGLGRWLGSLILFGVVGLWALLPLAWVVSTSLKPVGTEMRPPVTLWPPTTTGANYRTVLQEPFTFQRAVGNSLVVASCVAVGALLVGSTSAYAIARLRFRGRISALLALQAAGLVPPIVVLAPTFVLLREIGLLGTLWGVILPNIAYSVPLANFLMAITFAALPTSLEDAAAIDGVRPASAFWQVMLPLAAPGLFSAGVLAFLGAWGEFLLTFVITRGRPAVQTVPVAILSLSQAFELRWAWVSAAIVLSLVPVLLLVMVFQRWVVRGLTAGAVKYE